MKFRAFSHPLGHWQDAFYIGVQVIVGHYSSLFKHICHQNPTKYFCYKKNLDSITFKSLCNPSKFYRHLLVALIADIAKFFFKYVKQMFWTKLCVTDFNRGRLGASWFYTSRTPKYAPLLFKMSWLFGKKRVNGNR